MKQSLKKDCGISKVMEQLGGKWKLLIIWRIHQNEGTRFNQLKRDTNGITNVMLTRCLKELIQAGFVSRKDFLTVPPHVEYYLTEQGKSFIKVMENMNEWGRKNL
ncbi:MAG: helix-turn-helix domain-containing protein [Muricomes sp.]